MGATKQGFRNRMVAGAALTAIGLFLRVPPAAADLSLMHSRCANVSGTIDEAIATCSFLIQSGADFGRNLAVSYYNRGVGWGRKGERDRAIDDFTQAIRIDPRYARAYNARGSEYGKKNEFDRAIADFSRAIELDPTLTSALNNRGFTLSKKGEFDRAIADASAAIRIDPDYARAYATRGSAYAQKGELEPALFDLDRAIRLEPTFAPAYNSRGLVFRKRNETARALADFDEAIRRDPGFAPAYNDRALLHADARDFAGALSDFDQAIRINPSYALAYVNRGRMYESQGDNLRALADFNRALSIDPNRPDALAGQTRIGNADHTRSQEEDNTRLHVGGEPVGPQAGRPQPVDPVKPSSVLIGGPEPQKLPPASAVGAGQTKPDETARTFAQALAECEKSAQSAEQLSFAAPGGSEKLVIPACYKGRIHLECTMNALLEEAAAISSEYGEIVRQNYPDRRDVKAICSIPASQLQDHRARANTFDARALKVQQVFESNASCIESVRTAIGEINLGSMRDPGALMSSLLQYLGEPIAKASAQQKEVMRLVGEIDASRKAMATVDELRRLACTAGSAGK
jgi:tetratricopeptide (TPR) repeat protein